MIAPGVTCDECGEFIPPREVGEVFIGPEKWSLKAELLVVHIPMTHDHDVEVNWR